MNDLFKQGSNKKSSDIFYIKIAFFILCAFYIFAGGLILSKGLDIPLYFALLVSCIVFLVLAWFKGKLTDIMFGIIIKKKSKLLMKRLRKEK